MREKRLNAAFKLVIAVLFFLSVSAAAVFAVFAAGTEQEGMAPQTIELDESGMFVVDETSSAHRGYRLSDDVGGGVGVLLTGEKYGSTLTYTNVVDLNEIKGDVVRFEAPLTEKYGTAGFQVSMIDLYDPENSLSVIWNEEENVPWAARVTVEYKGNALGRNNKTGKNGVDSLGTLMTTNNFSGRYNEPADYAHAAFSFQYDIHTNEIFIDPYFPGSRFLVLNAEEYLGFPGFTTGEVLLQFRFLKLKNTGGVVLTQAGGRDLPGGVQAQPSNCIRLKTDAEYYRDNLPVGVLGKSYPIPEIIGGDGIRSDFDVDVSLSMNGEDRSDLLDESNRSFMPDTVGEYVLTYEAEDINGFSVRRVYHIEIGTEYSELRLSLEDDGSGWNFGEYRTLPKIAVTGGCGKSTLAYRYLYNGKETEADARGEIRLSEAGEFRVVASVTDYLGITQEREWTFEIEQEAGITLSEALPYGVCRGTELIIPEFTAADADGTQLDTAVLVNGTKVTDGKVSVGEETSLEVRLQGVSGTQVIAEEVYSIPVFEVANEDPAGYILADGIVKTNDRLGVKAESVDGGGRAILPNAVSVENVFFDLVGMQGATTYEYLELKLTDSLDEMSSLSVRIYPLESGTALRVRGADGNYTVSYSLPVRLGAGENVFCLLDAKTGILYDSSKGKTYLQAMYTDQGHLFTGFASDEVRVEVIFGNGTAGSTIFIRQLSNQKFAYVRNWADKSGPVINLKGTVTAGKYATGTRIDLPAAVATDVLQQRSTVTLTVTDPDNVKILDGVSVDSAQSFTMSKYGNYKITYTAMDTVGQETLKSYTLQCVDTEPPVLTVNGTIAEKYALGSKLILPDYSVSDNLDGIKSYIMIRTPGLTWETCEAKSEYCFREEGKYMIVYYVRDAAYNITRKEFEVMVERA